MGHCARCVEIDIYWDFVGSKVIRHLFKIKFDRRVVTVEVLEHIFIMLCFHPKSTKRVAPEQY